MSCCGGQRLCICTNRVHLAPPSPVLARFVVVWIENTVPGDREPRGRWMDGDRNDEAHTRAVEGGGRHINFENRHNPHLAVQL